MSAVERRLVTIFAEPVLKERLIADLQRLGARGYSIGDVEGHGTRDRVTDWQGRKLRIETIVDAAAATRILEMLSNDYFAHYAVVACASTVEVVRGAKFTTTG